MRSGNNYLGIPSRQIEGDACVMNKHKLNAAFFNLPLLDCEAEFESLSLDWLALNKFRSELDERKQDLLTL